MTSTKTRAALAASVAVFASVALAGCFANPIEGLVKGGVEQAVEGATGGDVSLGGQLPAGFPSEIPLIDGEIGFGGSAGEGSEAGWVVTIQSEAADPIAEARAKLEAAGFTAEAGFEGDTGSLAAYRNERYGVVVAGETGGVLYTVTPVQ